MVEGRYVYCIIDHADRKSFGMIGIGERYEVYTIPCRDVSAVVSNSPMIVYEPNEENVLAHMNVIQKVMQEHPVLPLKFGTVFRSDKDLKVCLETIYVRTKEELSRLKGMVEVGVKVLWHPDVAIKEVRKNNDRVKDLEREIADATAGRVYLLKVKLDGMVKTELNKIAEHYSSTIFKDLKKYALDSKQCGLVGHMIMNGAFLIWKDGTEFKEVVNGIKKKYEPKGLETIYSGPWPAFNFVNINYK